MAAGQIPPQGQWSGEVTINQGRVHHEGGRPVRMDLPAGLSEHHRDIATASLNILWGDVLRYRADSGPVDIGPTAAGSLVIGSFTRPDDGLTYTVADWRDIDDASYTFYFREGAAAPQLAIKQYNN